MSDCYISQRFSARFWRLDALGPVMGNMETAAMTPVAPLRDAGAAGGAEGAAAGAEGGAGWAGDGVGSGFAGDSGAWASAGDAPSLGGLSVPPNWAWSAAPPPPEFLLPAGAPLGAAAGADLGAAGLGFPFAFGGLPKAAAIGAAAGVGGAAASKYASRLKVVARSPEAGYAAATNRQLLRPSRDIRCPRARYHDERKRTRAARVPAGDRIPADQRTRSGPQMTGSRQRRCPCEVTA